MEERSYCALENQQQAADEGSALFSPILRRKVWILDQIGERTGAYIFVCGATKNIIVELYRTKDEFPILFEEVLIFIESKGFQVKRIHFDSAAEEIGSNVQKLGAQYGFVLDPKPPNVWKEHGYQEKAVGDITRIMRQMISLAPHHTTLAPTNPL